MYERCAQLYPFMCYVAYVGGTLIIAGLLCGCVYECVRTNRIPPELASRPYSESYSVAGVPVDDAPNSTAFIVQA
jgi:hypothetical protein